MAILHRATLTPTKLELLAEWLPKQAWFTPPPGVEAAEVAEVAEAAEGAPEIRSVGAFRLDDPDGEVGLETILIGAGDAVFQVPLTYRAEPLDFCAHALVGTMEHSVLGQRWVYDACFDHVYASRLATTTLGLAEQAEEIFQAPDGTTAERREPTVRVAGVAEPGEAPEVGEVFEAVGATTESGITTIHAPGIEIRVQRQLKPAAPMPASAHNEPHARLTGTWPGQEEPALLASLRYACG